MARHHLSDDLMAEYAAGSVDPGHALVIACHTTLCPECRAQIEEHESIAAALWLELDVNLDVGLDPAESPPRFPTLLDALPEQLSRIPDEPAHAHGSTILPRPLVELVGPLDLVQWRRPFPGLRVHSFEVPGSQLTMRLTQTRPGLGIARHGHSARELDLVLSGGLYDHELGTEYERGDLQITDETLEHNLRVLPGEVCTILTACEGTIVPRGVVAELVYRWLGWT